MRTAAIVTVGSELVEGLRVDTNTAEIARALAPRGFRVARGGQRRRRHRRSRRRLEPPGGPLRPRRHHRRPRAHSRRHHPRGGLSGPGSAARCATTALAEGLGRRRGTPHVTPRRPSRCSCRRWCSKAPQVIAGDHRHRTRPCVADRRRTARAAARTASEMRPMLDALARSASRLVRAQPPRARSGRADRVRRAGRSPSARSSRYDGVGLTVLARPGDVRVLLLDDGRGRRGARRGGGRGRADARRALLLVDDGATLAESLVRSAIDARA